MPQKTEDARMRFAANVKRLCRQHDYSMNQLVDRSQIGTDDLDAILHGEAEADVESVHRLAGALDVLPGKLYDGIAWIPDGEGGGEFRVDDRSDD